MAVSKTKKRMLLVCQMLLKETDEKHTLNANDIIERLKKNYEIDAEQVSRFLTKKKSKKLIDSLTSTVSRYETGDGSVSPPAFSGNGWHG